MRLLTAHTRHVLTTIAVGFLPMALACSGGDAHNPADGSASGGASAGLGGTGDTGGSGGAGGSLAGGTGGALSGTGGATSPGVGGTATGRGGRGTVPSGGAGGTTAGGGSGGATSGRSGSNLGTGGVVGTGGNRRGGAGGGRATAGSTGAGGANPTGGAVGTGGSTGGTQPWCLPVSDHPQGVDWAKALIDGRKNVSLGWAYPDGLYLHGVYLHYKRLKDASYLTQLKSWADRNVNGSSSYNSLDSMQPTLVLLDVYREAKDAKYGTAPAAVAKRLETDYPKTSDGGYWHKTDTRNQLWGDGVFMDLPPYVNYGELFDDSKAIDVATQQLIIYDKHLAAPNNLHVHQWDGSSNKQSCCEWCRAEGWYEMALLMVLDFLPPTHPDHEALIEIVQRLAKGLAATQDPDTGRWWQVMDKGNASGNWLETSCTAMHTYFLSKASEQGYIDAATYAPLAIKGFGGEMQMVSNPSNVQIKNICPGTGVLSSPAEYYARPPATNDNHGLGAFLLMYDQLTCR